MRNTKLIQLLSKLDTNQLKAFDGFVLSPYFNTNKRIIDLWKYLKKYAPSFDSAKFTKEKAFKATYPKEAFNENNLRQLRSKLLKLVEEFLAIERFKNDDFRFRKEIGDAYLEKGIKDEFEKKNRALQQSFGATDFLTSQALKQKLSIHHQAYFNEWHVEENQYPENLAACTEILEKFYLHQKLLYTIEWLSFRKKYNLRLPNNIKNYVEYLRKHSLEEYNETIHSTFENAVKLLLQEDKALANNIYIELKTQFVSIYEKIDKKSKNLLLRLLINYCIDVAHKGKETSKDVFELYRLGISDGTIFYKNLLTNVSFINIVVSALKVNEIEWADNFIRKESYRLYQPQKTIYLSIANANIFFYKEEFENCLRLLSSMVSTNLTTVEVIKRSLKLKAAFECYLLDVNYKGIIYADLESFSKFIKRKKILSPGKRMGFLNFINFTKRFINLIEKEATQKDLTNLHDLLIQQAEIPNDYKKWLSKHINKYIKMELHKATP